MKCDLIDSPGHKRSIVVITVGCCFALVTALCLVGARVWWVNQRSLGWAAHPETARSKGSELSLEEHLQSSLVNPGSRRGAQNSTVTVSVGSAAPDQAVRTAQLHGLTNVDQTLKRTIANDDADAALFATLERLERQLAAAIAKARESVVALEYTAPDAPPDTRRVATGVVINYRGDVLSINIDPPPSSTKPAATQASSRIIALDSSGRRHSVHWVATDPETGLTLLRLAPRVVRPIRPARGVPNLGSQAFVVGNPFGMGHSVSRGHVAGLDRALDLGDRQLGGLIQVQVPLYPGDSGAAVVNLQGDWLGLIRSGLASPPLESESSSNATQSSVLSPSGASPSSTSPDVLSGRPERDTNFGFAIAARDALWVADQLRAGGRVDRAYLGVRLESPSTNSPEVVSKTGQPIGSITVVGNSPIATKLPDSRVNNTQDTASTIIHEGAILHEVLTDTPASRAGLRPGDHIVELDGHPIRTDYDLTDRLDRIPARATIILGIVRDCGTQPQRMSLSLCTASRPVVPQVLAMASPPPLPVVDSSKTTVSATVVFAPVPEQSKTTSSARANSQKSGTIPLPSPAPDDLRLTLPTAVVDRLEKLERRLEKLESSPTRSSGPPAPEPQVSSSRRP